MTRWPWRGFAQDRARLRERFLGASGREQHVIFGDDEVGRSRLVAALPAQRDDLHPAGQCGHQLAERLAGQFRIAHGDFEKLQAGARGHLDLRLQQGEGDVEEQDRPGHAERVGDRVADCGIVVAERRDRRLQRRRAGSRTSEQSQRVPELEVHHLHEGEAHRTCCQHAGQRDHVRPKPAAARQPDEELLSVLHAHAVEEEREPQRSDHRRRHRLRREPAHGECDEEHRSHAERESLDVDFAHKIADGDRQEQRHQRLLLEQCLD